jgi:hypothetical protein
MRLVLSLVILLLVTGSVGTAERLGLYQGRAIVTGTGEESRQKGFASALQDVLVKVSGDARLIGDARVAALMEDAVTFVDTFAYRDRMEGIPIHDEQGSRDRPHDLTVTFDPEKIDAALAALGREVWLEPRSRILFMVDVDNSGRRFPLAADGVFGIDMRAALSTASELTGVPVVLPKEADLARAGLSAAAPDMRATAAKELVAAAGADRALVGSSVWSPAALGWTGEWSLHYGGKTHRWQISGVSFDAAFRNAVRGTAQVMSKNGMPF